MPKEKKLDENVVFKYHGRKAGLSAYQIPAKDLTTDDLARLEHIGITEQDVVATKLYRKIGKGSKKKGKSSGEDDIAEEMLTIVKE